MQSRYTLALVGGLFVVLAGALLVIGPGDFFIPEETTTVDGNLSSGDVLKRGSFTGTGHSVSGNVSLVRVDGQLVLQFEDYRQQQGPDVFIYVTPSTTPDSAEEIRAGQKILIDGGEDGGESTIQGTFQQPLPPDVSAADINGVGVWCAQFSVPFGYASLSSAS